MEDRKNSFFNRLKNYTLKAFTGALLGATLTLGAVGCVKQPDPVETTQSQPQPQPQPTPTTGQRLELEEKLIEHYGTLSKDQEPHLLQDFTMSEPAETGTSAVPATQTLEFNSLTPKMAKDNAGDVNVFLHAPVNTELYTWKATFENGLTSRIINGRLDDLLQQDVNIGGLNYRITNAETQWLGTSDEVTIDFLTGKAGLTLNDQDNTIIQVDGVDYDVTVAGIYTAAQGYTSAQFTVNGESTPNMFTGDTYTLANGQTIGVYETKAGWVEFCLGAQRLRLKDVNINDAEFDSRVSSAGAFGTVTTNTQAKSRITGSVDTTNNTLTLDSLEIAVLSNPTQDTFVAKDHTLADALDSPAAAIIDVAFHGLKTDKPGEPGVPRNYSAIDLNYTTTVEAGVGVTESNYTLSFTNKENIAYTNVPLIHNDGSALSFGGDENDLILTEGASETDYNISAGNLFVVNGSSDFTHILTYDSWDSANRKLTFTDLGTGARECTYDSATGLANLVIGGQTFSVYVDQNTGNLAIDQNGDGVINGSSASIVDQYGARLSFAQTDSDTIDATLDTDAANLDSGLAEQTAIQFERESGEIDMNPASPSRYENAAGHKIGRTRYGTKVTEYANGDLGFVYPELQEQPDVSIIERN